MFSKPINIISTKILFDPLEQFLILPFGPICPGILTNVSITLIIITLVLIFIFGRPSFFLKTKLSIFHYFIYNLTKNINEEYVHHHYNSFFPIIYFVFLFIFSCNFFGLIPYSFTITSSLIITLSLSIMLQIGINLTGIYLNKFKFLTLFLPSGTPLIIAPFLVLIELVSYLTRTLSLAIRLFVNMMAGHTLLKILIGFT